MNTLRSVLLSAIVAALAPHNVEAAPPDDQNAKAAKRQTTIDTVVVTGDRSRDALALDSVVGTGSRLGLSARDLPASVSVVTQEMIELRGARTAVEAIEAAVGMTGGTSVGSIPNYATRGFAGNDITIMRDGIRQNTASQSSRPLDSFLFDRIEVLKGPASLLYGEGAVGGAVNYVSKLPDKQWRGESFASAGAYESYRFGAGVGGPTGIDDVYFRADASHNTSEGYVDRSGYEYNATSAALSWEPADQTRLTFSATYLKDSVDSYYGTPVIYDAVIDQNGVQSVRRANNATDRLVNARIDPATRRLNYNNVDNFSKTENAFYRLIVETQLSPHWSLRNEAYAATQDLNWRNTESNVFNPVTQRVDRGSFLLIFRDDFQFGNRLDLTWSHELAGRPNRFLVGALYDDNDQVRNTGQAGVPPAPTPASVTVTGFDPGVGPAVVFQRTVNVLTRTSAAYLEDVFSLSEDLKLIGGLRYDTIEVERRSLVGAPAFTKRYQPFTGRLGAIYSVTPAWNVYASYSRAAQPVAQLVSLVSTQSDFSLQKGQQLEAGIKGSFFGNRADVTFAVFDIEKTDLLTSSIIDEVRVNSQIGAQVSQGAELAVTFTPFANWRVDANLAWTWKAEFEDFNENLGTGVISRNGNTPPNVPEWVGGVFVATSQGPWAATAGVRYVGEREANNNNGIQLDDYLTVEASVSRRWGKVETTLRGRNLTDELYAEWAAGGGLMQRLAEPRSAELTIKYAF